MKAGAQTSWTKNLFNKKRFTAVMTGVAMVATFGISPAMADSRGYGHHGEHYSRGHSQRHHNAQPVGRVIRAKPIYETRLVSEPRQSCWNEQVTYRESGNSATGTILGGIIGAAVGNELGHSKRNKQVGAVAGAVLGGSIGHDISKRGNDGRTVRRTEQRCETVYDQREERTVVGYRVKYRYNGQTYHTRTATHPGKYIALNVQVSPAHY